MSCDPKTVVKCHPHSSTLNPASPILKPVSYTHLTLPTRMVV